MTDDRKETPGMAEASAGFAHKVEGVGGDPLLAMRAERRRINAEIPATPEGEDAALLASLEDVEQRILTTEPQTFLGALAQIEVLVSMADEGLPKFAIALLAKSAKRTPTRLDGLLAAVATETGVPRLAALLSEHKGALGAICDATEAQEAVKGPEREVLVKKELAAEVVENEAWDAFVEAPCQTMAEVLFKMHTVHEQLKEHAFAFRVEDLFKAAMRDYERIKEEGTATTLRLVGGATGTPEQIDELQRLVMDAAAPLPSAMELLGLTNTDVHLVTVRELIRSVDDRMAEVIDAVYRLRLDKVQPAVSDVVSPQRSPLLSHILDMEPPITKAKETVRALERLVENGDLEAVEQVIIDLVSQLRQHIEEERRLFTTLYTAARGSEA